MQLFRFVMVATATTAAAAVQYSNVSHPKQRKQISGSSTTESDKDRKQNSTARWRCSLYKPTATLTQRNQKWRNRPALKSEWSKRIEDTATPFGTYTPEQYSMIQDKNSVWESNKRTNFVLGETGMNKMNKFRELVGCGLRQKKPGSFLSATAYANSNRRKNPTILQHYGLEIKVICRSHMKSNGRTNEPTEMNRRNEKRAIWNVNKCDRSFILLCRLRHFLGTYWIGCVVFSEKNNNNIYQSAVTCLCESVNASTSTHCSNRTCFLLNWKK